MTARVLLFDVDDRVALVQEEGRWVAPPATEAGVAAIAVPDTTRTLSKTHARLDLVDGEWTVTDLNSTNGVIVVGPDDAENLITVGEATPLTARFVLGKVGMRVSFDSEPAA